MSAKRHMSSKRTPRPAIHAHAGAGRTLPPKRESGGGDADLDGNYAADAPAPGASSITGTKRKHAASFPASASAIKGQAVVGEEEDALPPVLTHKRPVVQLLSQQPAAAQAAGFWALFLASKCGAKLSDAEIDRPLAAAHIADGGAAVVDGATAVVADLHPFIQATLPSWKSVFGWKKGADKRAPGAPAAILVTFSGVRAASFLQPLAAFKTRVAKLFAKHLSIEQQHDILRGPPVTLAVGACAPAKERAFPNEAPRARCLPPYRPSLAGTPNRLAKLLEDGSLSLAACALVVFDVHVDVKGYSLLTHPGMREDAFALYRDHVHPLLGDGKCKLGLY